MSLKKLATLTLMGAALAAPMAAQAYDKTVTQGSVCSQDAERNNYNIWYSATVGVVHHTETPVNVGFSCPVPRSQVSNTNGLQDLEIQFYSPQPHPPREVYCHFSSMSRDLTQGGRIYEKEIMVGQGNTIMNFGSAVNWSSPLGGYGLYCSLPNDIYLSTIYTSEYQ